MKLSEELREYANHRATPSGMQVTYARWADEAARVEAMAEALAALEAVGSGRIMTLVAPRMSVEFPALEQWSIHTDKGEYGEGETLEAALREVCEASRRV
jgi:hypothetical protein